jgi:glycine oxidase
MVPGEVRRNGTLVVASARDLGELRRFACRTTGYEWLEEPAIAALEPSLGGRFRHGLFFRREAHLDPRRVLCLLRTKLTVQGVTFVGESPHESFDSVVDCTGAARIGEAEELRGVRGEMLYLRSFDVDLSRPVRLLHPRFPVYIVPRGDGVFMVGATMIETEFDGPIVARSLMELLNAAYKLFPAFADATIIETGVGIRPAFPDNLPRASHQGTVISLNGLYRHGFLLAPSMAAEAAELVFNQHTTGGMPHEIDR